MHTLKQRSDCLRMHPHYNSKAAKPMHSATSPNITNISNTHLVGIVHLHLQSADSCVVFWCSQAASSHCHHMPRRPGVLVQILHQSMLHCVHEHLHLNFPMHSISYLDCKTLNTRGCIHSLDWTTGLKYWPLDCPLKANLTTKINVSG